jgi:hypothetical protein
LPLAGALRFRVEEIAPTEDAATSQSSAIATLVDLARGATAPLNDDPANRGLKDLLKTAEVSQNRNRVVIKATLPPSFFSTLTVEKNIPSPQATTSKTPASH